MIATVDYISKRFDYFNDLCFGGQLKPLPFKTTKARTFLGAVSYKRSRKLTGGWLYSDFVFRISTLFDMAENEIDDVILHEMIHYYILSNNIKDTSAHGRVFRQIMKLINERYGRHIVISHRRTREDLNKDIQVRQHFFCIVLMKNGRHGITIAAKTRIFELWNSIPKRQDVASCRWFVSSDPFFNRYPKSRSVKIYAISNEDLEEHLRHAKPLLKLVGKGCN